MKQIYDWNFQSYYSAGAALNHGEGAVHLLDVNGDGFVEI